MSEKFTFSSPEGEKLVREILKSDLPRFEPHVDQVPGICKVLDGVDLVAVTPTGSGKTGYLFMTLLVMRAIGRNPSLCPTISFSRDPVFVVICPTNTLEKQMEKTMADMGINALAINAETVSRARAASPPVDLWASAREGVAMLLLGPEQLSSKDFGHLLEHQDFHTRVAVLGVDEIHLLVIWGSAFRHAFTQIGFMRQRFPENIPLIGLTATLHSEGDTADAIFDFLGVNRGEFYLIKRSNARYDIQMLFRVLHSGINGMSFPELSWVLKTRDKMLIFGATINLVFRLKLYLNLLLCDDPDRDIRVQTVHGLNWDSDNETSIQAMKSDPRCQILISTNTLAQGSDIATIKFVLHIGEPDSPEMYVQKPGRAGRDPTIVTDPCAIFYIPRSRMLKAVKVLSQTDEENSVDDRKAASSRSNTSMSRNVAKLLVAPCKPAEQDRQFGNPDLSTQPICECAHCTLHPRTPRPAQCNCSGCLPEDPSTLYTPQPRPRAVNPVHKAKDRLSKAMKEAGAAHLREFRLSIWKSTRNHTMNLIPMAQYLPDVTIQYILDRFALFQSVDDVLSVVQTLAGMKDHACALFDFMCSVMALEFREIRAKKALALKEKRKKAAAEKAVLTTQYRNEDMNDEDESSTEDSSSEGTTDDDQNSNEGRPLMIRIPARVK